MEFGFELHAQALTLRAKRAEILANNLVNADTPGFKAQDLNFQDLLNQASETVSLQSGHSGHLAFQNTIRGGELVEVKTTQPSKDGNTVDSQQQIVQFTENAMQYQASLQFMNGKIKTLLSAIRGE